MDDLVATSTSLHGALHSPYVCTPGNLLELRAIGMRACGKLRALDGLLDTFSARDKVRTYMLLAGVLPAWA